MKGISTVIATVLMLMITMALIAVAWGFISGIFTGRMAISLSLSDFECPNSTHFRFWVTNDGTSKTGTVTISVTAPDGSNALLGTCSISSIGAGPGTTADVWCTRATGKAAGGYKVTLSHSGIPPVRAPVYCAIPS
jgi:FlaG/FlaF family flagellin (archaellin)